MYPAILYVTVLHIRSFLDEGFCRSIETLGVSCPWDVVCMA